MTCLTFRDVAPQAELFHRLVEADPRLRSLTEHPVGRAGVVPAARAASARSLDRAGVAAQIVSRLSALDAPPEAVAAGRRIAEPGSVVVVAGQQPGLFGGPHLAFGKALAAVALAGQITRDLGLPAVPVFWNASEDHDHGEVDHVAVVRGDGSAERLRAPLPEDGRMLCRVDVPPAVEGLLFRLADLLPDGPGREEVLSAVRPEPGDDWGTWYSRVVLRLLGRLGLVVVEPETLRPFARDVVRHEIDHPGVFAADIARAQALLRSHGFAPPLELRRPELFFVVEDGRRRVARAAGDGFDVAGSGRVSGVALLERLAARPEAFSWNVAARILAQDVSLPVAAQICGPSELGYAALMGESHVRLGLVQPALIPRPGLTFVGPGVRRACSALGIEPADVVRRGAAAVPESPPVDPDPAVTTIRDGVASLPQEASAGLRRRRDAISRAVDLYVAAVERGRATQDATRSRRRLRVLGSLRPGGRLQERVCSLLPWVARHGTGLLDEILPAMTGPPPGHRLLIPSVGREE